MRASALAGVLAMSLAVSACGRGDDGGDAGVSDGDGEGGTIALGTITDLTGPFAGVGEPFTAGQAAFWEQINSEGGLEGGWEVDVTSHVEDSGYDVTAHADAFNKIKDDVLAISQSLGTAHTNAILGDATDESMIVGPASLGSNWIWDEAAIQVGTSYCAEGMNVVDYAAEQGAKSVAVVHLPGDYGDDAMVGARIAAEENGLDFTAIETGTVGAGDDQSAAIGAVLKAKPDLVLVATTPQELATVVGGVAAQKFQTMFVGSIPTWNTALLESPAAPALEAMYMQATSFPVWDADFPGMERMRETAGDMAPNDWYSIGYASGYVMKAILEEAIANDDVTREGVYEAAQSLTGVDGEGTLPEGTGNYSAEPNDQAVRETQLNAVDPAADSKLKVAAEPFVGPTAESYEFTETPCYEMK
ncbi:ABC transporter substrate-binding protein [Nocardioides panacisoli]|uniref:ABC transporter substrate-binding protein n=1 Tax=Nocardioides panacisoli TaxID=627624 RepID=UPI001C637083|nr:ABC transporter substrate-binding protein [Nocardioides panacisoli]QYJ02859.1 ABC transporter substrate-binding protein [Nocardioides panacisoli]